MTEYRYPLRALAGDYVRSAVGFGLTGTPLLLANPASAMIAVLGGLSLVFAAFGLRTALRHRTVIRLGEAGVSAEGPLPRTVNWQELRGMTLRFYSLKRGKDRNAIDKGWMQLKLVGGESALVIDSTLDGFEAVVARATTVARARGLEFAPDTVANLAALGLAE